MNLENIFAPTYKLDVKPNQAKHWIVIGAGGNGGYLIPNLLRQISLQNKMLEISKKPLHQVTIIDADEVEHKNLTRQNFIPQDVNRNKAEVMASRYGRAFGTEVTYISEYLDSEAMLKDIIREGSLPPVVIGAVDNNKTRAIIHNVFKITRGMFWLDAGNEEWAGQVVLGYNAQRDFQEGNRDKHVFNLPSVADIYPEILEATDKLPTELSCAERAVSNPQNIFTNQLAATLMMGFANTILTSNEGLTQHAIAFNSQNMSFTTTLNKGENLIPKPKQEEPVAEVEVKKVAKKVARKKKEEATS